MSLTPSVRKLALTAHVTTSVGWLGAVLAFLALALTGLVGSDPAMVQAAYLTMGLTTDYVIVPLALAALATGVISSLASPWGLIRHYWVLTKLGLILLATAVLLMQIAPIGDLAATAQATPMTGADLREARMSPLLHAVGGLVILLLTAILAIYKPRGRTRYGLRDRKSAATPS